MASFKNNKLQYIYDLYTQDPPKTRGSGLSGSYFRGKDFPDRLNLAPEPTSLAYAAWRAGVDAARRAARIAANA